MGMPGNNNSAAIAKEKQRQQQQQIILQQQQQQQQLQQQRQRERDRDLVLQQQQQQKAEIKKKRDAATAEKNRASDAVRRSYQQANSIPTNTQLPSSTSDPKTIPTVPPKIAPSSSPGGGVSKRTKKRPLPGVGRDYKDPKKSFLNFFRVLMKYLENRDKNMHAKAKSVLRECADENKRNNPAFASLSVSMQVRLRDLVGEAYWKKTEDHLCEFLKKDYEKRDGMDPHQAMRKAKEVAKIAASPLPEWGLGRPS